jgi:hypothetical protein
MKDLSVHMSVVDGKVMLEWNTCGSEHGPVRGCYAVTHTTLNRRCTHKKMRNFLPIRMTVSLSARFLRQGIV